MVGSFAQVIKSEKKLRNFQQKNLNIQLKKKEYKSIYCCHPKHVTTTIRRRIGFKHCLICNLKLHTNDKDKKLI